MNCYRRTRIVTCLTLRFSLFTDPTRIFEHHGDYQCTGVNDGDPAHPEASAGLDCLTESLPDGYGKLITRPLGLEGDINDARAPNSTVLEWYYQLSARWVPKLDCSEYPQPSDDDETEETVSEHSADTPVDTASAPSTSIQAGGAGASKKAAKAGKKAKLPSAVHPRPKAMSFHNYAGPGDLNDKQSSFVFTYQVNICFFVIRGIVGYIPFVSFSHPA